MLAFVRPVPARADSAASTRNIILAGAAIAAAIIISNNVHRKQVAANTIVGRTADGGLVYGDGRVVYPNGDVLYTSNGDGRPCNWQGYGSQCGSAPVAYYPSGYNGHDHGNHNGWYKHHHHGDRDDHDHGDHDH
ncbi:MAG: hypothetical protein JO103_06000 [Candidatus Eremiobacteraeota bacterium]|nr:hypothetical protein [Candidatus Eremiobacteraeota bacterium]MBV9408174.1 hypothetical protein [Candidatus Eremiobacteraeota bacterium]